MILQVGVRYKYRYQVRNGQSCVDVLRHDWSGGKRGGGKWWRLLTYISIFLYNCLSIQVPFFGHHFLVFLAYIIPVFPHLLFSPSALCLAWGFCLYFCLYLSPVFLSFIFAYHSANDLHSVFLFMIQFLCFFFTA